MVVQLSCAYESVHIATRHVLDVLYVFAHVVDWSDCLSSQIRQSDIPALTVRSINGGENLSPTRHDPHTPPK